MKAADAGAGSKTVELDLDTTGNVAGIPDSQFSSPRELGAVLAKSPQCQECMVKQYFRYTAGRLETPADRPVIRQVLEDFRRSQFQFQRADSVDNALREFPNRKEHRMSQVITNRVRTSRRPF